MRISFFAQSMLDSHDIEAPIFARVLRVPTRLAFVCLCPSLSVVFYVVRRSPSCRRNSLSRDDVSWDSELWMGPRVLAGGVVVLVVGLEIKVNNGGRSSMARCRQIRGSCSIAVCACLFARGGRGISGSRENVLLQPRRLAIRLLFWTSP